MLLDGLMHLGLHDVIAHAAYFRAECQGLALVEFQILGAGRAIDILNDIALAVAFDLARFDEQIVALPDPDLRDAHITVAFEFMYLDPGLDAVGIVRLEQLDVSRVKIVFRMDRGHLDSFDQPQIIGADRIELVEQVVKVLVGGGIAQRCGGVQIVNGLRRTLARHILRLVDNQDWPRRLHQVARAVAV